MCGYDSAVFYVCLSQLKTLDYNLLVFWPRQPAELGMTIKYIILDWQSLQTSLQDANVAGASCREDERG